MSDKIDPLKRWRERQSAAALTWKRMIKGDAFVRAVEHLITPETDVLEFGHGYGRLLMSLLTHRVVFGEYCGVDVSQFFHDHCEEAFGPRFNFVLGDCQEVKLDKEFGFFMSSLTLKHMYPTWEKAMRNAYHHLLPWSYIAIDFKEGEENGHFEPTGYWISKYRQKTISEILKKIGFRNIQYDEVAHTPDKKRLLVIAQKMP
jgi:SAM-dependent methyltransferase